MSIDGRKTTRPKGYAPWKPHRKTLVILDQVHEILWGYMEYLPLTIRQVFYILVGSYGYPKYEKDYEKLTNYLNRARRAGIIEFDALRDDGISLIKPPHYNDAEAFYAHVHKLGKEYRCNKLANQDVNMRVLCEAAGMMPQLYRVASDYSVPVYSCSGFDSLTAKYELAKELHHDFLYRGRSTVILHLGDFDPSGVSIYDSMVEDVHGFLSGDLPHKRPHEVAWFHRVALFPDQIEEYDLTTYPPKATDKRTKRWLAKGLETCQLEALPPDELAAELRDAIESYLDADQLAADREQEKRDRQAITLALPSAD